MALSRRKPCPRCGYKVRKKPRRVISAAIYFRKRRHKQSRQRDRAAYCVVAARLAYPNSGSGVLVTDGGCGESSRRVGGCAIDVLLGEVLNPSATLGKASQWSTALDDAAHPLHKALLDFRERTHRTRASKPDSYPLGHVVKVLLLRS